MRTLAQVYAIWKRETGEYFYRPIAYVLLTVFAVAAGSQFYIIMSVSGSASMRPIFDSLAFLVLFFAPLITMRLYAEERRSGNLESLLSLPVRPWTVVLGKFFSSLTFYAVLMSPTFVYVWYLYKYGNPSPDAGAIVAGYVGICLSGATYLAVGSFASSLTRDQIIAAATTMIFLLILYLVVPQFAGIVPPDYRQMMNYFSLSRQNGEFFKGVIDSRAVVMHLSITVLFLYLTARLLNRIR